MNNTMTKKNNLSYDKLNLIYDDKENNIGLIVKKYRAKRGITRQVLANKSGISLRYLAQLESGNANPTVTILTNIANALNLTLSEIFYNSKNTDKLEMIDYRLNALKPSQRDKVFSLINNIYLNNKINKDKSKIALIGLRGAGKTTIGNMYKKEFNVPLFEATTEIENMGGMNINEIIELGGQGMYRRFEYDVVRSLYDNNEKLILLTGGSIVSENKTYNFILNNYFTVWIKASPSEHMKRVLKQGDSRPMGSNPRAMDDLNNILNERTSLYSKADVIIDTENIEAKHAYSNFKSKLFNN
jgi:XRE family transcriptional regulator, aerobic/anaerobic benzoate catabolism transcriptional regulator